MILHRLAHTGTHAFPHEAITLDFASLPALLAIQGPNGAGKTTALDLIAGAAYAAFPYRPGALHRHFVTKGFIDLAFTTGDAYYHCRVNVDPTTERTDATLTRDGQPIAGPLVRDYRRAMDALLGPMEMFLASAYSVQNGTGAFLRMGRAERKALLMDLLGLHVFPAYESLAKGRAVQGEKDCALLAQRIAQLTTSVAHRDRLEAERTALAVRRAVHEARLAEARVTQDDAAEALAKARDALTQMVPLQQECARLSDDLAALHVKMDEADGRRQKNLDLLAKGDAIRNAAQRAEHLRTEIARLTTTIEARRAEHSERQRHAQAAKHRVDQAERALSIATRERERIERLAGLRTAVPCQGEGIFATCPLLTDAVAASASLEAVRATEREAHAALTAALAVTVNTVYDRSAEDQRALAQRERDALTKDLELLPTLDAAVARVEELSAQIVGMRAEVDAKRARVDALSEQLAALSTLETALREAQTRHDEAATHVTHADTDLREAEKLLASVDGELRPLLSAHEDLSAARASEGPLHADLEDWTLLTRAFGASGIPALLIDQALPELSALATQLLRESFGEEVFTITLTTQRENVTGDKLLETLDVIVRRGGEAIDAALLSGGESVLVSEALALAIALFNAGRSGKRFGFLLRDEVGAALDRDRAPAYVNMLRKAGQIGGFRHTLFVSHDERAIELADAVIEVGDGRVVVR